MLVYLWNYWCEIHAGRTQNGMDPCRATHLDIMAWQMNSGVTLRRWEHDAIQGLSRVWLRVQRSEMERQRKLAASRRGRA